MHSDTLQTIKTSDSRVGEVSQVIARAMKKEPVQLVIKNCLGYGRVVGLDAQGHIVELLGFGPDQGAAPAHA